MVGAGPVRFVFGLVAVLDDVDAAAVLNAGILKIEIEN